MPDTPNTPSTPNTFRVFDHLSSGDAQHCVKPSPAHTPWAAGIKALDVRGDAMALRKVCRAALRRANAAGRLAAAEAMLGIGEWVLAAHLGRSLTRTTLAARGWLVVSVAAWVAGRSSLARRAIRRVDLVDRAHLAHLWVKAESAVLVDRQRSADVADRDPSVSLLRPLLSQALVVLDREVGKHGHYADVHYHRGMCLAEIGLHDDAAASFRQAININPGYTRAKAAGRYLPHRRSA
ncbi:MAG: tetratricopeptide repeat protein [Phycisphaerales bacterium]|nr:tetratricopeptide repeat protein [Phycisphaerales bacterium]